MLKGSKLKRFALCVQWGIKIHKFTAGQSRQNFSGHTNFDHMALHGKILRTVRAAFHALHVPNAFERAPLSLELYQAR